MLNKSFIIQLLLLAAICMDSLHAQTDEQTWQNEKRDQKLSRKRRYLVFPTGSSLQLVVDFGINLPDYTYYISTCVNYALAWALPDKPTYPQEEQYEMERLPVILRNDENVTDTGSKGEIHDSATYSQNNVLTPTPSSTTTTITQATKPVEIKPVINILHTVYPEIGKRSISTEPFDYANKFFIDHHRNSRHELYEIIENYLFAKGHNGTECLLKTLCEVGQKRHESEPGSFLAEIVRVIFSLPTAQLHRSIQKRHIDYDDAHQSTSDCATQFPLCPDSVWTAGFMIETIPKLANQNIQILNSK